MAERIKKSDIIEGKPFEELGKEIQQALNVQNKYNEELKETAKVLKQVNKEQKNDLQTLSKVNQAERESQKLIQEKIRTEKATLQLQEQKKRIRKAEIKEAQEKIRTEKATLQLQEQKKRIRKAEIKEAEKLQKAEAKRIKQLEDESNSYKRLVKETRDYKNESKRLGAELLNLESNGKRNTKAFRDLEKEYKQVTRAAQRGDKQLKKLDKTVGDNFRNVGNYKSALRGLRGALGALGVAFGGQQLVSFGSDSIALFREQQKAIAQVEAGLASTGNQAGKTSQELQKMASELQKTTIFGDEEILKDATAQLLTFTNISGEQFDRTQKAALDLATRLDGDLKSASIQLGKALNDPVANLSALSRSGIQFSKEQKEVIKSLSESGRLAEAQTLILDELNKQYGGSAEAAAEADGGITQLKNAFGDAKETVGEFLLEGLKPTIKSLKEFFENITRNDIAKFIDYLKSGLEIILKLTIAFVAFKSALFTLKMVDRAKEMLTYFKNLKNGEKVTKDATKAAKGFGKALKSIGFALAIELIIELTQAFYDLASGTAYAEAQQKSFDRAINSSSDILDKYDKIINESYQNQVDKINKLRAINQIDDVEAEKRLKVLKERQQEIIKAEIEKLKVTYQDIEAKKQQAIKEKEVAKQRGFLTQETQFATMKVIELNAKQRETRLILEGLRDRYKDLGREVVQSEINLNSMGETTEKQTDYLTSLKTKASELTTELDKMFNRDGNYDLQLYEELNDELKAIKIEIDRIQTGAIVDRLPLKPLEEFTGKVQELAGTTEDVAEETAKIQFDIYKNFQEALTEVMTDQIDARIELMKKEEEAAKDRQSFYEDLAAQGNIYAQQSIAEQIEIQREAQAEQIRLEQQKQRVEAISGGLATFTSLIEDGKSPSEALTQTVTSTQALVSILKNIPFFEKGTNYAPEGMAVVDEKGAEIITDRHGNIKELGSNKGARLTHLEQGDKVLTASQTKGILGGLNEKQVRQDNAGNSFDLMLIGSKLDKVENAIRNLPTNEMDWNGLASVIPEIKHTVKRGGDIVTNRYRT